MNVLTSASAFRLLAVVFILVNVDCQASSLVKERDDTIIMTLRRRQPLSPYRMDNMTTTTKKRPTTIITIAPEAETLATNTEESSLPPLSKAASELIENESIDNKTTTLGIIITTVDTDAIGEKGATEARETPDETLSVIDTSSIMETSTEFKPLSTTTRTTTTTNTRRPPSSSSASVRETNSTRIRSDPFSRHGRTTSKLIPSTARTASTEAQPPTIIQFKASSRKPSKITEASSIDSNLDHQNRTSDLVKKKKVFKAAPMLKQIHDYLIVVLLVSVMFAMGCSITWEQVWAHVCRPIGVIIGMISQFILLPACAYCLIVLFNIDPLHATGLLILACSPGGVTSNVFTYFCEGDLSLSVTMTSFSTVVALIMMPFNVWLYGRNLETETLIIPYTKMTVSLLTLTTPVAIGMFVNWKWPKVAPILTKIGSVAGFAIIIVCQTLEVFIFPDIFNDVPMVLYAAEFLLPLLGLALGFGAASILRLPYPIRRTVAIEAGIQNVGTALTIITLSFPFEQLRKVWLFPFLYAFSMLAVCCIVAIIYQLQKRFNHRIKSLDIMDHPKAKKIQQIKLQQLQTQPI